MNPTPFNIKGSAAVEIAFVIPMVCFLLLGFYRLFYLAHRQQGLLIQRQYHDVVDLHQKQMALPILERPCVVNEVIRKLCKERGQ